MADPIDVHGERWDDVRFVVQGRTTHWYWKDRGFRTDIVPGVLVLVTTPEVVGIAAGRPPRGGPTIELKRAEVRRLVRALGEWLLKRPDA